MTVRLSLFGSPTVEYGGESVALPFERRTQLLAFLALKREWVGRAEVAAMLWPEQESKLAYTNLRKTLHRLQSLPWARAFESRGSALRFEADTDVFAFDSALREQRIADAPALRRGELLVGFDDDHSDVWSSWLTFERVDYVPPGASARSTRCLSNWTLPRPSIYRCDFSKRSARRSSVARAHDVACARRAERARAAGLSGIRPASRRRPRACPGHRVACAARLARCAGRAASGGRSARRATTALLAVPSNCAASVHGWRGTTAG